MEPSNRRRVVRALEVTVGTGRRYSDFGPGLDVYPPGAAVMVGLALSRPRLTERLAGRLRSQMNEGFLDEVRHLATRPCPMSRTAGQAIGYRELMAHVGGTLQLAEALVSIDTRLRGFAKRQESWFRRDPRVRWFDAEDPDLTRKVRAFWETGRQ
jgi:tRNA dimethylallyltransferase